MAMKKRERRRFLKTDDEVREALGKISLVSLYAFVKIWNEEALIEDVVYGDEYGWFICRSLKTNEVTLCNVLDLRDFFYIDKEIWFE